MKALGKFDRDFRSKIGKTNPDNIDSHITVGLCLYVTSLCTRFAVRTE